VNGGDRQPRHRIRPAQCWHCKDFAWRRRCPPYI